MRQKVMTISLVTCLFVLARSISVLAQDGLSPEVKRVTESLEKKLADSVARDGIGSITAGVVVGDKLVWCKSFGWADLETRRPATTETIYRIGSISKSATATVLVQLAEAGTLSLDDVVAKYVPEIRKLAGPRDSVEQMTLRQLASHTSGLVSEPDLVGAASGPIGEWEQKVLDAIPATSLATKPGERYSYSNIGYGILGLAMSRAANKPFIELVHERLFAPLKMDHSEFILSPEQQSLLATGYANSKDAIHKTNTKLPALEHAGRGYKVPNGGVYSTVNDMAKFIGAQTGAVPLLSKNARAELHRFYTKEEGDENSGYGLGFSLSSSKDGSSRWAYHMGGVPGYSAALFCELESGVGIILLRNYNQGSINLDETADSVMGQLLKAN